MRFPNHSRTLFLVFPLCIAVSILLIRTDLAYGSTRVPGATEKRAKRPGEPGGIRWFADDAGFTPVRPNGRVVYVTQMKDKRGPDDGGTAHLQCRDSSTGRVYWETKWYAPGTRGCLTDQPLRLSRGKLFAGYLCLDARRGNILWKHPSARYSRNNPNGHGGFGWILPHDRWLFAFTFDPFRIRRLDTATGRLVWTCEDVKTKDFDKPPVVEGKRLYAAMNHGGVHCINVITGKLEWTSKGGHNLQSPIVADGRLYVCEASALRCVDTATGKEHWKLKADFEQHEDRFYLALSSSGKPFFFQSANQHSDLVRFEISALGQRKDVWRRRKLSRFGGPVPCQNQLYVLGAAVGDPISLRCLDLNSGKTLWTSDIPKAQRLNGAAWTMDVVAGGPVLYVGRHQTLYCISTGLRPGR